MKNETLQTTETPMADDRVLAAGLFVRNDIKGNPIRVGDTVRITREEFSIQKTDAYGDYDDSDIIEAVDVIGIVVLCLSRGIQVRSNKKYYSPKITDKCRNPWSWERL